MRALKTDNIKFLSSDDILTKTELELLLVRDNLSEEILYEYSMEYQKELSELEDTEFIETEEFKEYFETVMKLRIDDTIKRAFYEIECIHGNWSVRERFSMN